MLLILGLLAGVVAARSRTIARALGGNPDWLATIEEVERLIQDRHLKPPPPEVVREAAVHGMVETLNDPYTQYVPPQEAQTFEKDLTGQFAGIGAEIELRDGWPTVRSPMQDSPALAAGLQPLDRIVAVEGESTQGGGVQGAVKRLLGAPGTPVRITIERPPVTEGEPAVRRELTITRAQIVSQGVRGLRWNQDLQTWDWLLDPQARIAYVRVEQFLPGVAERVRADLHAAEAQASGPLGAVILDLRDNPGGLLDEAVALAGLFVERGVLVSTRARDGVTVLEEHRAPGGAPMPTAPVVVLLNQRSASGSEIVGGALQDLGRGVVVGVRSFGKGLVQRVELLDSQPGAMLKLTEQRYYLPSGRLLQREDGATVWGVDPAPGFYVPMSSADERAADRALAPFTRLWARGAAVPPRLAPPALDLGSPTALRETLLDPQLSAALDAAQKRLATGDWSPTGAPLPPEIGAARVNAERAELTRQLVALSRRLNDLDRAVPATAGGVAGAAEPPADLWPDDHEVEGGYLEVTDARGARVARLKITEPGLEAWLMGAGVVPETVAPPASGAIDAAPRAGSSSPAEARPTSEPAPSSPSPGGAP